MENFLPTLKRITEKCTAHFSVFHSPVKARLFFVFTIIILSAFNSLGQGTCIASASSNSPVCTGSTLNLYENGGYATSWLWTGPNGFSSTLQNPSIPNASEINSGVYTVVISNGECTSSASVIVSSEPIVVTGCPDDIVACADTFYNEEFGAYIDWQIPHFELNCMGIPGSSYNFVMGFELPEVKWACWTFNRVQRIGPSVVNLWQSTGTGDPYILTPSVYIEPPLNIEMDIVCEPGRSFTWSVYLVSGATESFAGSVFVNATGHYSVNIPSTFVDDIYRLKFVFSGNGNNKCAVDNIYFDGLLMDLGDCVGGIEFNVTGPIPGFYTCGDTLMVYTATYTSPSIVSATQTCEFNIKVECVTALVSSISNVSCASSNGAITVSAQSSSDVTPEFEYSINGGPWISFGVGNSQVTIGGLAAGTYSINVRDVSLIGDCEIYEPLSATVGGIIDNSPPTITCPSGIIVDGCSTNAITGLVYSESITTITALQFAAAGGTASDNCGIVYYAYQDSKSGDCPIIVTRTFTVRDLQGNSASCTQTIQVIHSAAPVVPANGGSTVACLSAAIAPVPPVVLDACGRNVNPVLTSTVDVPALISCEGTRTYSYTYTDCAGLSSVWQYIYTIERQDFTPAANQSSTIACAVLAVTPVLPVVNDNCGNPITPTGPVMSGTYAGCEGTIIYTYNYADCEGNNHYWVYTYTVERLDFVPPSPTSATVACYSAIVLPTPPVVTDNCGTVLIPTGPVEGTVPGCEGPVTYTWTYTDCEGNSHNYVHTVTIERQDFTPAANQSSTIACAALAVTPVLPVVNDNCGNPITPTGPVMSGTYAGCEGTIIYTYNYADCEGNNHNWIYTYTVERLDFVPPSPTSSTVACYSAIVLPTPPVVTDNCGTVLVPTGPVEGTVPGCEGTVTYTWTYTDCEGNTHDYVHTVTIEVEDFIPAANQSSTVACEGQAVTPALPVVYDNCGNRIIPTGPAMDGTYDGCEGTIIYKYDYADCEGNHHSWRYTYTIERLDFIPPSPTSATVACYASIVLPNPPVVMDNCGTVLVPTGPVEGTVPGCEGTVTYTWTYTDCEGNTHDYIHTVTIEYDDFIPPVNQSSTVACAALAVTPVLPAVFDKCGNPIIPTGPIMSGTYAGCEGTIIYTYNYADCEGNNHNWVYTYTVERLDFVPPSPTSATVACYSAIVLPTPPVVTDNCGTVLIPTGPVEGTVPGCEGTVTYTWTYTDCEGNTHNYVHTVTIEREDFMPATNQSSTIACAALAVTPVLPVVNDNCGNPITPTGPVMSGTYAGCEGTIIYTYNYADCEGNNHNWIYTYTVERLDFVPPSPTSATVACYSAIVLPTLPVVTDNCGTVLVPTGPVEGTVPGCEGTVTYTWTYTDCEGNTHDYVHTVTIERQDFNAAANQSSIIPCSVFAVTPALPTVYDNCGSPITPTGPAMSGTYAGCEGTIIYSYNYADCEGNNYDWTYTYTIERQDFSMPGNAGSTVACIDGATEPIPPVVYDNCNNLLLPSAAITGGTYNGCEGTRTYTFTYTDCEGNHHDWVYTYTIERVPFANPADEGSTVECVTDAVPPVLPLVTDNCGNILTPGAPVISLAPACEGIITYTYLYTDCEGNMQDWVYTYVIDDVTPPTGTAPANITGVQCIADVPVADIALITDEADNCGGNVTVTVNDINNGGSGCMSAPYIITRTYTLTDCSGLSTDLVQLITVADTTPPVIVCPGNIQMYNDAGMCGANVSIPQPTYSDGCGIVTVVNSYNQSSDASGYYPVGTTSVIWTAIDACGNTSSCTMSVTVIDNEPPVIVCPADISSCTLNINLGVPAVSDNCQVQSITNNAPVTFPVGIVTDVIWTVTDIYGNSATCVQSVTASDMTASATASSQVSCFNDSDGIITVTAAGGTGAYLYSLNYQPAQTSNVFTGLPAGTYVVWVSDENGCEVMVQPWIIIDNPPQLTVTATGSTQVSCNNFNDGVVTATASGGTGDYSYSLNGGPLQNSNMFTDLPYGNYVVNVYDEMGCEASSNTVVIINPLLLEVTGVVTRPISCYHGSDGEITAEASGGTGPYLYSINHSQPQSSNVFTGLIAGTYVIYIVDQYGCSANSQVIHLTDPPQLEAYIETTGQVSCTNGTDATITVIATGGIGTLSYRLNEGTSQVSNVFSGLIPGTYTITIYDENLCSITLDVDINNPDTLASDIKTKQADCSGKDGGMIELTTSGGTGNYSYTWSNGATTAVVTGLSAQTYFVTITDENGCTEVRSCAVNSEARTELEINNAFSPNGDGINDLWVINNLNLYPENEVIVLNRWGDEVFSQKTYQSDWNGSDLLEGTYFYIIKVRQCEEDVVYKGYVTILR